MKITQISYQKSFVTGPFLQERIGLEIEIDDTESPESALSTAKEIAESWHKANNPHLGGMTIEYAPNQGPPPTLNLGNGLEPIQWEKPSSEEERINALIKDINSCEAVKVLESYRLMVKANDQLQAAYDNKMNELTVLNNK